MPTQEFPTYKAIMAPLSKSIPPTLKKITVFLRRAEELDREKSPESRVVAYNCRQYAVLTGIPLAGSDASAKACLGELLDQLEKEKTAMSVFSKAEHWTICRKVAERVFDKADAEDRAGLADKGTAKTFYAAGTFYEILQQFYDDKKDGDVDDNTQTQIEEEEKKRLYCKWKATDILNAVKEGREPTPGGYQQQQQQDEEDGAPVDDSINTTAIADSSSNNNHLPPAPEMPPPNLFITREEETNKQHNLHYDIRDIEPPPSYDGVELNLDGDPVEDAHNVEEASDDIFIPGPLRNASADKPIECPPPYTQNLSSTRPITSSITVPTPPTSPPKASSGVFSSFFGISNSAKLSKNQINDAIELTKFALAALQKGDGELGRQRLEQALNVLK